MSLLEILSIDDFRLAVLAVKVSAKETVLSLENTMILFQKPLLFLDDSDLVEQGPMSVRHLYQKMRLRTARDCRLSTRVQISQDAV